MAVTITTGQPYYVRGTSGFFKGELTDLDGKASVDCYFEYRIKLAATWSDTSAAAETMSVLGKFVSASITLTEGELYEVRSVATWMDGTAQYAYGSTIEFVSFPYTLSITNPGAETGDTTGWSGAGFASVTTGGGNSPRTGSYFFSAGTTSVLDAYQDISLPSTIFTEIDTGHYKIVFSAYQAGWTDDDSGALGITAYDASSNIIEPSRQSKGVTQGVSWALRTLNYLLPPGTRTIRLHLFATRVTGLNNDVYWDDISAQIEYVDFLSGTLSDVETNMHAAEMTLLPATFTANRCATMTAYNSPSPNVVWQSTEFSSTYRGFKAFDKSTGTFWLTTVVPCWIWYSWGAGNEKTIRRYSITARGGGNEAQAPKTWTVGLSHVDRFGVVDDESEQVFSADETKTFNLPIPEEASHYLCFRISENNGGTYTSITEIELFEIATYKSSGYRTVPAMDINGVGTGEAITVSWTATTPTNTDVTIETAVTSELTITDEAVGTGDGTETVFTLDYYPVTRLADLVVKVDAVATTAYTISGKVITFTTAPGNTLAVTASYTGIDDPVALDWSEITTSGNNATLPATRTSKHLWIRQTLATTDTSVTPTLTEMVVEVTAGTTSPPTTLAPTTLAPTTAAPTTVSPTSLAPTTIAPTTIVPTTVSPTTIAPTTIAPTTLAPTTITTTVVPTTIVPTSLAPTTLSPTTTSPTTLAPTTVLPTTIAPTTLAPTTISPTTIAPTTLSPTTLAPTTSVPTTLSPTTIAPTTLAPTVAPTTLSPTTLSPTTLSPTTFTPTTLAPTSLAPTTLSPTSLPPTTIAPTTIVPTTAAPTTLEPTTLAPTTVSPTTIVTTVAPTTLGPTTLEPTTLAPTTLSPTTLAPTTITTTLVPTTDVTTLSPTTLAPTTVAPTTLSPTTLVPTTLSPTTIAPTTIVTTLTPTTILPTTLAPTTSPPSLPDCGYLDIRITQDSLIIKMEQDFLDIKLLQDSLIIKIK